MEYLKPDEIGKFNELVAKLTDVMIQMRITTKRMGIKVAEVRIYNFDDIDPERWTAEISSSSEVQADGTFTSFWAECQNGKQIAINSKEYRREK